MKGLGGAGAWEGSPGIWSLLRLVARFPWFELEFGDGMRGMGVEDGVYVTGCRWWARGHMECEELMRARWVATWRCSLAFNRTLSSPFASGLINRSLLLVFSCHSQTN
jgi:hypothetical protein